MTSYDNIMMACNLCSDCLIDAFNSSLDDRSNGVLRDTSSVIGRNPPIFAVSPQNELFQELALMAPT